MEFRGDKKIKPKKDIIFQIIDWEAYDYEEEEVSDNEDNDSPSEKYIIRVYGVNSNGRSVSVKITDYKPYFFVYIPYKWKSEHILVLRDIIKKRLGKKFSKSLLKCKIIRRKRFRGFENNKIHKFLRMTFASRKVMSKCRWIFDKPININNTRKKFDLYESNIDPMLRFIHSRNIKPGGWVCIKKYFRIPIRETRCQIEIETNWKNVSSLEDKNDIAPLIVASFDIEADSSHGDFPQAIKDYQKLAYDIIYKINKLTRNTIMRGLKEEDDNIKTLKDIDTLASSQEEFEKLCVKYLRIYIKSLIIYAFYDIELFDLKYSFEKLGDGINKVYTKKNKKPDLSYIMGDSSFDEDVMHIISYINIKTSIKNTKEYRDAVKYCKTRYLDKNIYKLENKVKSVSKSEIKNKSAKFPYYYKDILAKLIRKEYLVKELNDIFTDIFPKIEGDPVIQIGTTCQYYGKNDCFVKHIITLDTCDNWDINDDTLIIESYKTEREVLLAWKSFICRLDPDIVLGYNIFAFDFAYLYNRAKELNILEEFSMIGRKVHEQCMLEEKQLSSSALGFNVLRFIKMTGVVLIDLYKVIQSDHKLKSYKLDFVAQHFTGNKKDDVTPKQIFEYQKRDSYHRGIIAKYCVQDCVLCNYLTNKLNVISNKLGMANVCSVPLSFIFLRGQGIKIFSLIAKECRENKFLLPVLENKLKKKKPVYDSDESSDEEEDEEDAVGYEGAIVLDPTPGIYYDPIVVLDYSSLYPSSMISENLSHDTYCVDKKWLGEAGKLRLQALGLGFRDVTYNVYKDIDPKKKAKGKIKVGEKTCRFVQYPNNKKGIIPRILMKLLQSRKDTRAKIKTTEDPFQKQVLDGYQLAFKLTANSLYGQLGAKTSNVSWIDIAASTTAVGRELVMFAKHFVEDNIEGSEVVYGDSIPGDEPVLIKNKYGKISLIEIQNIVKDNKYRPYDGFKAMDSNRKYKQQYSPKKLRIWVDNKWVKIKRIIRHRTKKRIFRVSDSCGRFVDVTEDHSLIINRNEERVLVKPTEIKEGDKLISSVPDINDLYHNLYLYNQYKFDSIKTIDRRYRSKSKINMQCYYLKLMMNKKHFHGYELVNQYFNIHHNMYNISIKNKKVKPSSKIISYFLRNTRPYEYVYDIETESGVFSAGIGCITLKNTDSIFIKFRNDKKLEGKAALQESINLGLKVEEMVQTKLKKPHKLEYEKTFWPYVLLSKKRYIGNLYEFDPKKYKQKSMGIVLKRRDNAGIVKEVYNEIIEWIINKRDIDGSITYLKNTMMDLINGKIPLEKLVISKSLNAQYKNPDSIAHKVLADRMAERDPGNKPQTNDRIPYVYINVKEKKGQKILQGNRIEHPEYIKEKKLTPDYKFYITNQIMKPVLQVYSLIMDNPESLFKEVLRIATNRKNKSQEITKWFIKK